MKIAVIQGSSQKDKNQLLYQAVLQAADENHEVINFGVYPDEDINSTYVETAFLIALLLHSKAIDFAVTGCSSGQGMMLACNSFPGLLCGYVQHPSDAYLFGRINNGNAVSYPLGLNFGWGGELNLQYTMQQLFMEAFGTGYPKNDAARKQKDAKLVNSINAMAKKSMTEVVMELDASFVQSALQRTAVYEYLETYGNDRELIKILRTFL